MSGGKQEQEFEILRINLEKRYHIRNANYTRKLRMYVRNKESLAIKSQNTKPIKKKQPKKKIITSLAPIFHIQSIPILN